jgi:hypothetical protein
VAALRSSTGAIDSEFEVRSFDGSLIDLLPKVELDPVTLEVAGDTGVVDAPGAAQFEVSVDQEVPGQLRLTMLPIEELRYATNRYEIWPYMVAEFDGPNGQRVTGRWQYGAYPWTPPKRTIEAVGHEIWEVACLDRSGILEDAGPGLAGWNINAGTRWADDIPRLVELGGLDPTLVVLPDSDEKSAKWIRWWYQEDKTIKKYEDELRELQGHPEAQPGFLEGKVPGFTGRPLNERGTYWTTQVRMAWLKTYLGEREVKDGDTSLLQIIADECSSAGWERPFMDYQGRLVVRDAITDLRVVQAQHVYDTGPDSIIICPVTDEVDITEVRNRGFGVSAPEFDLEPVVVLLEDISPMHPACESRGRRGAFRDFTRRDDKAGTKAALQAAVARDLRDKANGSRSLSFSTLANHAHEVYDFAAMRFEYDPELAGGVTFHTRRLAGDFHDHTMTHQHWRTWIYGDLSDEQRDLLGVPAEQIPFPVDPPPVTNPTPALKQPKRRRRRRRCDDDDDD